MSKVAYCIIMVNINVTLVENDTIKKRIAPHNPLSGHYKEDIIFTHKR